jgi:hypothetical protein
MSVFGTLRTTRLRPWVLAAVAPLVIGLSVQACADGGTGASAQPQLRKTQKVVAMTLAAAPVGQTRSGRSGVTPGTATFRPAMPGRVVLIQGKVGSRWKTVTKVKQDRRGQVAFTVTNPSISYRAVAPANKRANKVVTAAARSTNWGKPTWRDEFSGSGALNPAIWSTMELAQSPKFACVDVLAGNAYRQKGAAVLKVSRLPGKRGAKTKKCPYGQFGNALVHADKPQHHLMYGMAAARVKFAPLRGLHSAFWMDDAGMPRAAGDSNELVEIDIAEYFGDDRRKGGLASYVHSVNPNGSIKTVGGEFKSRHLLSKNKKKQKKKQWSQGWHVYSVEWSPTGYVFRVDGKVTLKTAKLVSRHPEKVLLSAITSDWEQPALKVNKLPTVTKFDWVRVWQRPGA